MDLGTVAKQNTLEVLLVQNYGLVVSSYSVVALAIVGHSLRFLLFDLLLGRDYVYVYLRIHRLQVVYGVVPRHCVSRGCTFGVPFRGYGLSWLPVFGPESRSAEMWFHLLPRIFICHC